MTFDYTTIRDNVVEVQIEAFGKAATLTQPGTATGDEWDPTAGTPTTYSVMVLEQRFSMADRSGTLVQEDDRKFLMSTDGSPAPDLKGTLTIGSDILQVVNLEPYSPGSVIMFYRVHCRK